MKFERSTCHPCHYHILIFIIFQLLRGNESQAFPGYSINVSSHVTVQRGLCVYIPCSFTVPTTETLTGNAVGIWYKWRNTPVASNNRRFSSNGRFFLIGDVQRGDCSLYIENPLYEDQGSYYFRVEDNIRFNYQKIMPFIEVTGLTDKPDISPMRSWLDGEEVTLSCTSPGTCRGITPKIIWKGNTKDLEGENYVINHTNGTKTHFSNITFTANKAQNNSILSCTVQLEGILTTKQEITIGIGYPPGPPEIHCSIISENSDERSNKDCAMDANNTIHSLEGSRLSLSCSADSIPESSLVWKYFNETKAHKLIFDKLSLANDGLYTCQATNIHGTSNTSVTIKIRYPPRPPKVKCFIIIKHSNNNKECAMDANNTIYIPEGSGLSLSCSADSVPESSMVWKSSNETKTLSTTDKLILHNLSLTNEGLYTCHATNLHGTSNISVAFKITYGPKIANGTISSCWKVQNQLVCNCLFESFPCSDLQWKINGVPVNISNHRNNNVSIFTETSNSVTNSTLTLKVNMEESQHIQCVASNQHGELVQVLLIEIASSMFPAASIYIGCFVILLIVIGALILLVVYKKRQNIQQKESSRQTHVSVTDPIYGNAEMFSNGSTEVGQIPQKDQPPPQEMLSEVNDDDDVQYMSVDFSKLKPKVATEEQETEYAAIKQTN